MVTFAFDDFSFDDVRYELSRSGAPLRVDTQVLELLAFLLRNPARLVTKEELIAEVWQGRALGDNVISVCVAKLRKALGGPANRCITNVYGRGYRFLRPVRVLTTPPAAAPESSPAVPPPTPVPEPMGGGGSPFVGRSAAVGRLQAALARARGGRGGLCALLGEAGIGKTRAAEVLEEQALAAGFRVSWGRCHVFGDAPPLWPWLQVVRSCEAQLPAELIEQPFEALMRGAAGEPDSDADEGGDSEVGDGRSSGSWEPQADRPWHKTLRWMSDIVARVTAEEPWLIVLEDLQWADAATLELLAHVVTSAASQRILLLLTARDTELPTDPRSRRALDYVLGHRECERVELSRLREADVATYTKQLFGRADEALTRAVFAKSEGNPFFMVELLRPWVDGPTPQASALTLSGYALDIIRQALRRLDVRALDVLSAAAVVGRSFDLGLLASVTESPAEALIELLEDAMSGHVIVAARESHTHFVFGHELIRHVLYEDLASINRVRLHQRVAQALTARMAASGPDANAELAHHLLAALPSGDVAPAITAAQRAAFSAMQVGAAADACAFLRRALEALRLHPESNPRMTCRMLYDLATCERAAGEPTFTAHYAEAIELARRHQYAEVLFSAAQRMSQSPGTVAMPGVGAVLDAALAALPENEHRKRAIVLSSMSWTTPYCRDQQRVDALLREADQLAEKATDSAKRAVLRAHLYYAGGPDDYERALSIAGQMDKMSASRGRRKRALWSLEPQLGRIVTLLQRGEFTQAQRAVEAFGAAARELQHAELIWHYERMCVVFRMNSGDFEYARQRLLELKQEADKVGLHARRVLEAVDWGELIRQTTDITPFAPQFARGLALDASDNPNVQASKLRSMVNFGLLDEARAALEAIPAADLPRLPKSRDYLATLAQLALAGVATRCMQHVSTIYELLTPYPGFCVAALSFHCHGVVSHFLAILARAMGQRDRARRHFEQALADQERLGLQPHLARSRYEFAALLAESTEDRRAREQSRVLLGQASSTAAQLGMLPLKAAADQLVATLER
ncbi:MAG TPA: AAA family ATPase [Polyangiales bacterium]|nr:AAA family ATPase [Polyangiales bacterium]